MTHPCCRCCTREFYCPTLVRSLPPGTFGKGLRQSQPYSEEKGCSPPQSVLLRSQSRSLPSASSPLHRSHTRTFPNRPPPLPGGSRPTWEMEIRQRPLTCHPR